MNIWSIVHKCIAQPLSVVFTGHLTKAFSLWIIKKGNLYKGKRFETFQEFMDWSVQKIVDQGDRCTTEYGTCIYGRSDGAHCLIGWHLPPNSDVATFKGGVRSLIEYFPDECAHFSHFPIEALADAQSFHDADEKIWRGRNLHRLITYHGIDPTPPQYQQWIDMGIGEYDGKI